MKMLLYLRRALVGTARAVFGKPSVPKLWLLRRVAPLLFLLPQLRKGLHLSRISVALSLTMSGACDWLVRVGKTTEALASFDFGCSPCWFDAITILASRIRLGCFHCFSFRHESIVWPQGLKIVVDVVTVASRWKNTSDLKHDPLEQPTACCAMEQRY